MGIDEYELGQTIARSARSQLQRAVRKSDRRPVIVKRPVAAFPTPRDIAQLEYEYRLLAQLNHPGIIQAVGLASDGDRLALILDDVGGKDLRSLAVTQAPLELFFAIALPVVDALGCVHAAGIVHKDIKPDNVVFNGETGEVRLIDFSIAFEGTRARGDAGLGHPLEGTLPYLSPEQTGRMNRDIDSRTDFYALGVTFFELLTGTLPFTATDSLGWIHAHVSKVAPAVSELRRTVPLSLSRIVAKLLAKDPDDRYQSALGLASDLRRCQREWAATGAISDFSPGEHDACDQFRLPGTLIGRERERAALLAAFEEASQGPAKLVLVEGPSGIGKSSLIEELRSAVTMRAGTFVSGKLDLRSRQVPYGALAGALGDLVRGLLAEPEARLQETRAAVSAALGAHGQVLVDLIPELERLLGPQPPVSELDAREASFRFQRTCRAFLAALATAERPLVIFLDDLHWADGPTPELLAFLLSDGALEHLLVLGACRENELDPGHPLRLASEAITRRRPGGVVTVVVAPLTVEAVVQLVAAATRRDPADCRRLAEMIFRKTAGTPFFVNELLMLLHREGALRFQVEAGRWEWDEERVEEAAISGNVIELVVQKLKLLPDLTARVLRLASCIGPRFDLLTLSRLASLPAGEVAQALRAAIDADVVVPLGANCRLIRCDATYTDAELLDLDVRYRFQHDRVQEAAHSQIPAADRARIHLALGRIQLASLTGGAGGKATFEVVNHLNLGRALISSPEERRLLARLNEESGEVAKRSAAYPIAASYFLAAQELTSPQEREAAPRQWFDRRRGYVECLYLSGEVEEAGVRCDELMATATDRASATAAAALRALIYSHQSRFFEAVDTIRVGLRALNVELPAEPGEVQRRIGDNVSRMQQHLGRVAIEELVRLPEMTDESHLLTMKLLNQLIPSAIQADPPVFILAELMMFDLALTHGTTAVSCKNFVDCGMIQAGNLGDSDRGYRLGKAAFALLERYAPTNLDASVAFVFASFVSHWRAPFRESLEWFAAAQRRGLEVGDLLHAGYAIGLQTHRVFAVGMSLDACRAGADAAVSFLTANGMRFVLPAVRMVQQVVEQLAGVGPHAALSPPADDPLAQELLSARNPQFSFVHGNFQTMASFIMGDFAQARLWARFTEPFVPSCASHFSMADHVLFQALAQVAELSPASSAAEREAARLTLIEAWNKLRAYGEGSPENFAHKHMLAAAELARLDGRPIEEVAPLYDQALAAAKDGFVHLRALINERQAQYWLEKQRPRIARTFFQDAYYLYGRWGAAAKLRRLEREHGDLVTRALDTGEPRPSTVASERETVTTATLDAMSVVKATQAISGEVQPERLFATLMATILENAGAQRGCLILRPHDGGELTVGARASLAAQPGDAAKPTAIEACDDLCPRIVRYVARTRDSVVLDDARRDPGYRDDAYVQANGVRSVLAVPVLHQGELLAILYAENNAVTHAFTRERLILLQIIAGQAAISIRNARLYDSLEERVAARTAELSRANETLAAEVQARAKIEIELRQAQKLEAVGRLASGVAHEINTPIQFVNDNIHFVRDAMGDLVTLVKRYQDVQQAVLSADASLEGAQELAREATEAEETADLAYLLENVPVALERSLDGIDRVAKIVQSMKAFAHPDQDSKVAVDLNQAVASTLTIARNEYKYVADVETEYGALPPVTCHVGEINQAVLNLIVNAAHAIADVVQGTERRGLIRVRTCVEAGAAVISISDSGGGIPPHIRDRIFEPFFTTKEVGKGTGQGLFIARSVIAEKHGGSLTFETETGKGTTFYVRLPIHDASERTADSEAA